MIQPGNKSGNTPLQAVPVPIDSLRPVPQPAGEIGGPKGLEPTRFGDRSDDKGRCTDF